MLGYRLDNMPVATLDPGEEKDPSMFSSGLLAKAENRPQGAASITNKFPKTEPNHSSA